MEHLPPLGIEFVLEMTLLILDNESNYTNRFLKTSKNSKILLFLLEKKHQTCMHWCNALFEKIILSSSLLKLINHMLD